MMRESGDGIGWLGNVPHLWENNKPDDQELEIYWANTSPVFKKAYHHWTTETLRGRTIIYSCKMALPKHRQIVRQMAWH